MKYVCEKIQDNFIKKKLLKSRRIFAQAINTIKISFLRLILPGPCKIVPAKIVIFAAAK